MDKPQELVIDHVSRTLSKLFAWAGLILSVLMVILYVAAPAGTYNLDVRFMGLCVVIAVISPPVPVFPVRKQATSGNE
nr:hypothetical protein [uncultured Pseudodesulfovibrio sp.]